MATYICWSMNTNILNQISAAWGWRDAAVVSVGNGLINTTWKINETGGEWLLQRVNTMVFPKPEIIAANLQLISQFLTAQETDYLFTAPIKDVSGNSLVKVNEDIYRVFRWIGGTHTVHSVDSPALAESAAECFGNFTHRLRNFPANHLRETLSGFHDLAWRYNQMETAIREGDVHRIHETNELIDVLRSKKSLVLQYEKLSLHSEVRKRVFHHDTKISNVLLNELNRAIAVIDLDTVMPGFFVSDIGDMFRTYVCPVTEEETNLDNICVRREYRDAIVRGYLNAMGNELTGMEKDHLYFGGEMLIYMQALRFLTDYLQRDIYYGSRYPGQNRDRAANQTRLLLLFQESLR